MKLNSLNTQSVHEQARLLMSSRRHKLQNRQQSMLNRASAEVGVSA